MANKIEHLEVLAREIEKYAGGFENVATLTHCMTRIRLVLKDNSKFDAESLKQIEGVKGVIFNGEQQQVIVGMGTAAKVFSVMNKRMQGSTSTTSESSAPAEKKAFSIRRMLNTLAAIFVPTIPALIGCGLIMGLINIVRLVAPGVVDQFPELFKLLKLIGSAVFVYLSIMIGVNTAKELGASTSIGAVMAGLLSMPGLADITLFGSKLVPGSGGIFAVLMVVVFSSKFEVWFRSIIKESLDLIVTPFVTILVSAMVAIVVFQPAGHYLNQILAQGVSVALLNSGGGAVATGGILGGSFLFLLLTGLHQGLIPIHAEILQTFGLNYLFPILAMGGMGQVGSCFWVYLKTKNQRLKKTLVGALPVGIFGVGEPLLFGVSLPLGKPFIAGCIGGAAGGALMAFFHVGIIIPFGTAGLSLIPLVGDGQILDFLIAVAGAWIVGFIASMIIGFTDPEK
ncbi:PTS transporter subunit EIIC [Providencia rettgeri]|uniref:PTS transporter subunit EIIC n=1 Tax=Providencia rettgeri TaxID=587 RepID=UPI0018C6E35A|nr:PTS transporter subunit EIIC [Providencia rettgeri]MBG5925988.1 PTS transporter subunit EIIC [Providencia rettgeri]